MFASSVPASDAGPATSLRAAAVALGGLSAVFLFEMLDNSILTVALPAIARELRATVTEVQWIGAAYAVVFGGLMLALSALADRVGRRRIMLLGLVLLGVSSLLTVCVTSAAALIGVRALMGVAAAMTTPGAMSLTFRLFADDSLRVRALTVISTVGLVGLAVGPVAGGFVLAVLPWQVLLLVNVPIAAVAFIAIRIGVPADREGDLHRAPGDLLGAVLITAAVSALLLTPTVFVEAGTSSPAPWMALGATLLMFVAFAWRERMAASPVLDLALIARRSVCTGLLFKAASAVAVSGVGFLITVQLQVAWGWSPAAAALGMLPQVGVLLIGGVLVGPIVDRFGLRAATILSALAIVGGLGVYTALGQVAYAWIAVALILIGAGMRVIGVAAGTAVLRGVPPERTTFGAALVDTAGELATALGFALVGTVVATMFAGPLVHTSLTAASTSSLSAAIAGAGFALLLLTTGLVGAALLLSVRRARSLHDPSKETTTSARSAIGRCASSSTSEDARSSGSTVA